MVGTMNRNRLYLLKFFDKKKRLNNYVAIRKKNKIMKVYNLDLQEYLSIYFSDRGDKITNVIRTVFDKAGGIAMHGPMFLPDLWVGWYE